MKSGKRIRKGLLVIAILFTLTLQSAFGLEVDAADGYTYTVTFYAGNHGTFSDGKDSISITGLRSGNTVFLNPSEGPYKVDINNDKYYIKGIRKSGSNTSAEEESTQVIVEGDADYVVAYGIKGDQVAYTVTYEDAAGNELAPSRTFYGNIGDKPVIAYQYIDGYQPQAYNLTKTLSANEADNVFPFIYDPADTGNITTITQAGTVTVITQPATPAAGTTAGTGAGTAADAGTAGGTDGGTAADDGTGQDTVEVPDEETPQALQDLDDEEVPKANINAERKTSRVPIVIGIVVGVLALAALASTFIYLKKRGKIDPK